MTRWTPDPTFYPSPSDAAGAPAEQLAYIAAFDRAAEQPDAIAVVDTDPANDTYGQVVGWTDLPHTGDELHHFGWNACSSALCPTAPHPHVERRYLIVPGLRSSRIYVLDTKDDPRAPKLVKEIPASELADKAGYSRPHTIHCGPDGIYISALGAGSGDGGPGGIAVLDHTTFDVRGAWESDRGDQFLAYDFWWHLTRDVLVSSEWGTPDMIENGINPELLLGREYGHRIHFWDLAKRNLVQSVDLGDQYQMTLELRPAHDPTREYGFVGVVVSVEDLSASVWVWHREAGEFKVSKVIDIPAEPADAADLPPALQPFGAVPPLVTDIDLSVDDRFLYVSCWGTGELKQYDVSDPFHPVETGSIRLGGVVGRVAHPSSPTSPLAGGPQMVEVSRDGKRVYVTNSLYGSWDDQFYPDGVGAWLAKIDVAEGGGMELDQRFFPHGDEFRGRRVHQVRLQGGGRELRLVLLPLARVSWGQLAALVGLGAFHGLNPAMGWLFAVARGMQERSRAVLLKSLPPIAAGHLASVAIVASVVSATESVVAAKVVGVVGGLVLVGFGLWRLLSERHFRWAGMRLNSRQLAGWSFLMSSAHGAGLMLLPVLATTAVAGGMHQMAPGTRMDGTRMDGTPAAALEGLAAAGVHTLSMFAVMAACAIVVYEFVGVNVLRRAWFNVDKLWAAVIVGAGALTIALTA